MLVVVLALATDKDVVLEEPEKFAEPL